jgi:hypothetical protein
VTYEVRRIIIVRRRPRQSGCLALIVAGVVILAAAGVTLAACF